MTHARHRLLIAATLTAATLVTGCQSDAGGAGGGAAPLSLSGLTKTADGMPDDGASTCPLPYDVAEAAKAAGLNGATGAGAVRDDGDPVATAEGGKRARPGEPLAENPGVLVSCTFHIGEDDVQVHTVATRKPQAIAPLAPVVQMLSGSSVDELVGYMKKAGDAEPGDAVVTGSGNVAAIRLKLEDDGDAYLLVGLGEAGTRSSDRRQQVSDLAGALAGQLQ
ncbi:MULTISPECIES: hypothetical protein [Streptomyces]|uniref:Uncharacterized protein n=1 Tax=Streptomyces venezuelae TaxID=54571 RepID=A0A5P2AXG3_STRVZ|nr:hypothetical protein [Streptomyces venezuelae]QES22350.1 hypothetical protein DEJ46_27305 [Streptomyces venezuelae]